MFEFKPAIRMNTPIILVVAGPSGSGKTWSLLELAMGLAGKDGKVALIDTEGNRALLYSDYFKFDHCELRPPYAPKRFLEALKTAEQRGYSVVIVDSMSDSYVGEGGMVDMANAELERVKNSAASWARPKSENKLVVRWFRQARCHVLLGLRAEEKVRLEKVMRGGREQTVVVPIGFQMISEKNLPYEATVSFMLHPEQPGVPHPVKLPEQFKQFFPLDKQITRRTGERLAAWCAGGAASPDVAIIDGVPQRRSSGGFYTQAEADAIANLPDPRAPMIASESTRDGSGRLDSDVPDVGPTDMAFDRDDPFGFGAYPDPDPALSEDGLPMRLNAFSDFSDADIADPEPPPRDIRQLIPEALPKGFSWPGFGDLILDSVPGFNAAETIQALDILKHHEMKIAQPMLYAKVWSRLVDRERSFSGAR